MNAVPPEAAMPQPVLDEAAFEVWLKAAHPGSRITLHRGLLCVDRQQRAHAPHDPARAELNRLAARAMRASGQGLVHLVQRRHGDADYSYVAVRARRAPPRMRGGRS